METKQANELATRFGGDPHTVTAEIGDPNGWGWADAVLAAQLPDPGENPYEYRAYDLIRDEWPAACKTVETDAPGAENKLRRLMRRYRAVFAKGK